MTTSVLKRMDQINVEYEQPSCPTRNVWVKVPKEPTPTERVALEDKNQTLAQREKRRHGVALLCAP